MPNGVSERRPVSERSPAQRDEIISLYKVAAARGVICSTNGKPRLGQLPISR